jgi:hypothetical protein
MTAPDFITQVTEILDYGVTSGFLIKDITGEYDVSTNPGGWVLDADDPGVNLDPTNVLKAMLVVTPYKKDPIYIPLDMSNVSSPVYWQKLLNHLGGAGITITKEMLGLTVIEDGHWQFQIYYWPGYQTAVFTLDPNIALTGVVPIPFKMGEIVVGQTSGASGHIIKVDATPYQIAWIHGTFLNGEVVTGQTSGASQAITTFATVGSILTTEVYSYTNHQSILTIMRNMVRKLPLDVVLPRINEKHVYNVAVANNLLDTLDDAVEVGQIANFEEIFDFVNEYVNRIDQTYCIT